MNIDLYDALNSSYGDKKSRDKLASAGYKYDSILSNHNQQVWYNPNEKKLLYNIAGTHNLYDVGTDAYLLAGKLKSTSRYREADDTLNQAKQKYQPSNTTVTGHSLGSSIGSYIAKPEDKFYGFNEGATIGQLTRLNDNHKHYRTQGDLVSLFNSAKSNMTTLKNKNGLSSNVLDSHAV